MGLLDDGSSQRVRGTSYKWLVIPALMGIGVLVLVPSQFQHRETVSLAKESNTATCSKGWNGTWSFAPARSFFTGNLTVSQVDCHVTVEWWELATDRHCRGQWLSGWIQLRADYTARNQQLVRQPNKPDCWGSEAWRPANMTLDANGTIAKGSSEVWSKQPVASPKPPVPSCLALNDCSIGFTAGFVPCCDGLVLQQDYSSHCRHTLGKYGYPEGGLSCQKGQCLTMGTDCYTQQDGCCPGLSCRNMGISGFMCA